MAAKKKTPKPTGRPSVYTDEVADTICERLCQGDSLRSICLADSMPHRATVFRWLADPDHERFRDQYAQARASQAEQMFEDILNIADDGENDYMASLDSEGATAYKLNGEHVQRSRLRVDTRKWALSKMLPKKYGDKLDLNHSGSFTVNLESDSEDL